MLDEYEIVPVLEAKHGSEAERRGARKLINLEILHTDKYARTCASPLFNRVSYSESSKILTVDSMLL